MTAPHPYDQLIIQRFELELLEGYIDQAPIGLENEVVAEDIFTSVRNRPHSSTTTAEATGAEQVLDMLVKRMNEKIVANPPPIEFVWDLAKVCGEIKKELRQERERG